MKKFTQGMVLLALILSASVFSAAKDRVSTKARSESRAERILPEGKSNSPADEPRPTTDLQKRIEEARRALEETRYRSIDETIDEAALTTEPVQPLKPEFKFDYSASVFHRKETEAATEFRFTSENSRKSDDVERPWRAYNSPKSNPSPIDDPLDDPNDLTRDKGFQWGPAIYQSMMMIAIQHGYALGFQAKTRRALKGPFFGDYWRSVKGIDGWDDGNRFFTNYIAHPMQGALSGFIYLQNQPRTKNQRFGMTKEYWHDRLIAFAWSAAWSTQWEMGPISQSTIGNVGMYGGMGYVDLVITPTVGTAWLIAEEAVDRYFISKWERRGWTAKVLARMFLNPMRTIGNLFRFKAPWYRERPVGFSQNPVVQVDGR